MTYPKALMTTSELIELGYTKKFLLTVARNKYLKIACRNGTGRNSKWIFDTELLEKYRKAHCTGE